MSANSEYSGMTTNERLFNAGLLDDFDAAARARDDERMVAILQQVEFSESEARSITDTTLTNPEKYGF